MSQTASDGGENSGNSGINTSVAVGDGSRFVARERLWPSPEYSRYVDRLRAAIGETIHVFEITQTDIQLAACYVGHGFELVGVMEYPRPDPARRLYPHLLVLDDGRGINLGRIARVSLRRAFDPLPADVLYEERFLQRQVLYRPRRLSPQHILEISRAQLRALLGPATDALPSLDMNKPRQLKEPLT
jgi:hypothetical protein